MPQVLENKDCKMESNASTVIGVCTLAVTGALGWLKHSVNNTDKQQRALALHLAEHHMTKDDVKEFVQLTNQPLKDKMDDVNKKLDRLLNRPG